MTEPSDIQMSIYLDSDSEDETGFDDNNTLSRHSIIVDNLDKPLENIQEEENLIHYTDTHFNTRIIQDLGKLHNQDDTLDDKYLNRFTFAPPHSLTVMSDKNADYTHSICNGVKNLDLDLQDNYIRSNSPISGSLNGSREGSISGDSNSNSFYSRNLSIQQVQKNLEKYYDISHSNKYSSEIDILTTYIKGQKNLYIQSKYLTYRKLNCLMFPTLFLAAFITIVAPFIECQRWSGGFISGLNACIALLLSLINYLKLESSTEMYLLIANQYDKIETSLEMTNSKLIFIEHDDDKRTLVLNKIHDVELKIIEIKESNSLLIPQEIKELFPIICNINIFLFIKKMEVYKKGLLIKFRDVKNEIRYILYRWKVRLDNKIKDMEDAQLLKEKHRLSYLYEVKEKLKNEILEHRSAYSSIDELFTREIKMADLKKNSFGFGFCFPFWNTYIPQKAKSVNPIIDKYFDFILSRGDLD